MTDWTITITATTDTGAPLAAEPATIDRLVDAFAAGERAGAMSISRDNRTVSATFSLYDRPTAAEACLAGIDTFGEILARHADAPAIITSVEAATFATHDAELARPAHPELVGVKELADLLGVTRQRASYLARHGGFPEPLQVLAAGPVWGRRAVEGFIETWSRRPGRPRTRNHRPASRV